MGSNGTAGWRAFSPKPTPASRRKRARPAPTHLGAISYWTGWNLDIAGKFMAYIALGAVHENIVTVFQELYQEHFAVDSKLALEYRDNSRCEEALHTAVHDFFDASESRLVAETPEDILASFHAFLERLLVREMTIALRGHTFAGTRNLCIAGGCGLNIKWNSALRASGLFDTVWVPPFPNDSGSAIGAACCALAADNGFVHLDWSVYSGPNMNHGPVPLGWQACSMQLNRTCQRARRRQACRFPRGPCRAWSTCVGGRSILAAATSPQMKDHLNKIKRGEHFRPVAPICLEDRAHEIFEPGTPDPYMLFDHRTRSGGKRKSRQSFISTVLRDYRQFLENLITRLQSSWSNMNNSLAFRCSATRVPTLTDVGSFRMPRQPVSGDAWTTFGAMGCY